MTAVEAALWGIAAYLGLGVAAMLAVSLWPGMAGDHGAGALLQLLVYGVLIWLIRQIYFPSTPPREVLGTRPGRWYFYPIAALLGFPLQLAASGLYEAILARYPAPPQTAEYTQKFATLPLQSKVMAAVGLLLITPFIEEALFRGALFGTLRRRAGNAGAVMMTSALFALIHQQPQVYLPIGLVGAAIASLRLASGSMWPGVACHMVFNGFTFYSIATDAAHAPDANDPIPLSWVAGGVAATAVLLALTYLLRAREPGAAPPRAGGPTPEEPS